MNVDDIVSALRRVVEGDPRVDAAFLYGSAARQQMRPGSDVDVAVRWSGTVGDPARAYLELLGPLGQAVPHDVHLVDLATAIPELQRRIYADGVELVDRHPRRTRDNHVKALTEVADWEYARRLRGEAIRSALSTPAEGRG